MVNNAAENPRVNLRPPSSTFAVSASDGSRPPSGRENITNFSKYKPWLMFYDIHNHDDKCYFYSNSYCCTFRLPGLKGATIVEWFLAHRDCDFFFYSPFSLQKIKIAKHPVDEHQACKLEVSSCKIGEKEWNVRNVRHERMNRILGIYSCGCVRDNVRIYGLEAADEEEETGKKIELYYFRESNAISGITVGYENMRSNTGLMLDSDLLRADDWVHNFGARGNSVSSISICLRNLTLRIFSPLR